MKIKYSFPLSEMERTYKFTVRKCNTINLHEPYIYLLRYNENPTFTKLVMYQIIYLYVYM